MSSTDGKQAGAKGKGTLGKGKSKEKDGPAEEVEQPVYHLVQGGVERLIRFAVNNPSRTEDCLEAPCLANHGGRWTWDPKPFLPPRPYIPAVAIEGANGEKISSVERRRERMRADADLAVELTAKDAVQSKKSNEGLKKRRAVVPGMRAGIAEKQKTDRKRRKLKNDDFYASRTAEEKDQLANLSEEPVAGPF